MADPAGREAGIGVWVIQCGRVQQKVAASSAAAATGWFQQSTGLADFEYGDVTEVQDLDALLVADVDQPQGVDHRGRHIFGQITAREAIRRAGTFPTCI